MGVLASSISQELVDQPISLPLRYVCLFSARHILLSQDGQTLNVPVEVFMQEQLIFIGRMTEGVEVVALLGIVYVLNIHE